MKAPPSFWESNGILRRALTPLGQITRIMTANRLARPGFDPGIPVVCVGNVTVGGAGKTILTRDILARYLLRGLKPFALTRGHGGTLAGPVLVDPTRHSASDVGDEPLLLARTAPTIVSRDRAAGARLAAASGASVIVMDDGLQNPQPRKTMSLLVIDGGAGFGNLLLLPAGPLREPVEAAANRCVGAVLIGEDRYDARKKLPPDLPVLTARIAGISPTSLRSVPVIGFAGIGRPSKFFATLRDLGAEIVEQIGFPDHHGYSDRDLLDLANRAERSGATLVTTEKDSVKLPPDFRARCIIVAAHLVWGNDQDLDRLLP